jgi:enoyl-CoA hydratase
VVRRAVVEEERVGESVLVERRGAVQVVTINRPEAKNALDAAVAQGVAVAVDELEADEALRVGVLTGAGGVFGSGMDLKAFLRGEVPVVGDRGLCGITRTPPRKPLVAAVEGVALAGSFEVVLACDLVVAGAGARFGLPETKRGLVAAGGGALLLPRRVPRAVALEALLTGEPFGAQRAYELGLVNRVVEDGSALEAAVALAEQVAANGPYAVAVSKQVAVGSDDWSLEEGWAEQDRLTAAVFGSEDAAEGALAFAEKRAPVWKGR